MYVSPKTTNNQLNILKSARFVAFTVQVSDAGVTANAQGKKVVPAGTIFPANDATAKGIIYQDVDVTNGPHEAACIVEGYILKDRIPAVPVAAAITALKEIKFY